MDRRILFASLLLAALAGAAFGQNSFKKYDIKSGVVRLEETMKISSATIKNEYVVYFDDYGMKECRELWKNGTLTGMYFSDGKQIVSVNVQKKKAVRQGDAYRGTELRVEWTEMGTEKDRQSGKVKKMPARDIAGKTCEVIQVDKGNGETTVYAGYKKIMMLLDMESQTVQSVRTAVKIEENVAVPADKFKVPAGYSY